jgi:hypothetical protein
MPLEPLGGRRAVAAAVAVAALAVAAPPAGAAAAVRCRSADLRYPFQPGGPKTFGVFRLRVAGGDCRTAHRVAREWMDRFEGNLLRGHDRRPRHVFGFTFRTLPADEAQTFDERGRRDGTTIRFDYRVPNG